MKLFDIIIYIVLFEVFIGALNTSGLFSEEVVTMEITEIEDSIAKIEDVSESSGVGSDPSAFGLLKGGFAALHIFMSVILSLIYLYEPLTALGMPAMIALPIQVGIWFMYVAWGYQAFTGRSLKNIE